MKTCDECRWQKLYTAEGINFCHKFDPIYDLREAQYCSDFVSIGTEVSLNVKLYPKKCNLCNGKVEFIDNSLIYGKSYGSGKAYKCTVCGAYVGTYWKYQEKALGVLANAQMRKGKMICHELFDSIWKGCRGAQKKRVVLYDWLAKELGIREEDCHFGYFNLMMLREAYMILKTNEADLRDGYAWNRKRAPKNEGANKMNPPLKHSLMGKYDNEIKKDSMIIVGSTKVMGEVKS